MTQLVTVDVMREPVTVEEEAEQVRGFRNMLDPQGKLSDDQLILFGHICRARGLDPRIGQIRVQAFFSHADGS